MRYPIGTLVRVYVSKSSKKWPYGCLAMITQNDRDIVGDGSFPYEVRNHTQDNEITWHEEIKPVEDDESRLEWMLLIMKH